MKKLSLIIALLLSLALVIGLCACGSEKEDQGSQEENSGTSEDELFEQEYLEFYPLDKNSFGVSVGDIKYASKITIPSTHKGKPVTTILSGGFEGCSKLKSVVIENGITTIESGAFKNCGSLESVVIPNSVTSIGETAFYGCDTLTTITIPEGVTSLSSRLFYGCTSLKTVVIPNSITSIGSFAFFRCTSLEYNEYDNGYYLGNEANPYVALIKVKDTSITSCSINENTRYISSQAFYGCKSLTDIIIPKSVVATGTRVFDNCTGLATIYLEAQEKPSGWDEEWSGITCQEVWGYTGE